MKKSKKYDYNIEIDFNEFAYLTSIINNLILLDPDTIMNSYSFGDFLDRLSYVIKYDLGLLYMEEVLVEKIRTIINKERFKKENKKYSEVCNEVIVILNKIENEDDKTRFDIIQDYYIKECVLRNMSFKTYADFLESKAKDALLLLYLQSGDRTQIDIKSFFVSTIYCLNVIPELYKNIDYKNVTMNTILDIKNMIRPYQIRTKKYVKDIEAALNIL